MLVYHDQQQGPLVGIGCFVLPPGERERNIPDVVFTLIKLSFSERTAAWCPFHNATGHQFDKG